MCSPNLDAGHEVDVRDLRFADGTFDITVDKSKSVLVSCQEQTSNAQRHNGHHDDHQGRRMGGQPCHNFQY